MGSELEVESLASNGGAMLEPRKWILVTGGAGYIGSHTVLQLLTEGYCVVIIDNLDNSCEEAVNRVRKLAGEFGANLKFYKGDLCRLEDVQKVFKLHRSESCGQKCGKAFTVLQQQSDEHHKSFGCHVQE